MIAKLNGSLAAFLITLGLKHNPLWKKTAHGFLCTTMFFACNRFLFIGQIYLSLCITVVYMMAMMGWTFYVRYPLYCTYAKVLTNSSTPKQTLLSQVKNNLVLKPYSPKWKSEFLEERSRTGAVLLSKWKHILHPELSPDGFVHIGSTSIQDIALAKPQHDCALAITCDTLPTELRADLSSLGYHYIGVAPHSLDCADHFFFFIPNIEDQPRLGEGYYLHVLTPKVHQWLRNTRIFCEYLSENETARESYSDLKSEISKVENQVGE